MVNNFYEDMPADEISKLIKLMRLRDQLLSQILYGIREVDKTADMTLVDELELLTSEAKFVSREIHDILENRGDYTKNKEGNK